MKKSRGFVFFAGGAAMMITAIAVAFAAEYELKMINPTTLHKHPVYSQAAVVSGEKTLVFVAGQVDRGLDYELRSDSCRHSDWRNQYIGVMENIEHALDASGATWADVVFTRKFVTDMDKYLAMTGNPDSNLPKYFEPFNAPPSTLIQVVALSEPCQLVEIDVMAVVPAK